MKSGTSRVFQATIGRRTAKIRHRAGSPGRSDGGKMIEKALRDKIGQLIDRAPRIANVDIMQRTEQCGKPTERLGSLRPCI